jgi:hypothetical protein
MINNTFIALHGQNTFELSAVPANTANVYVLYNSVIQLNNGTVFNIVNNLLIFNNNAKANDVVQVQEDLTIGKNQNPSVFAYYGA